MDTVFPKGTAAARPFHIENGIAYGPGVMDMKSGLCMGVYTLKALLESGYDDADITVYFAGDEECNHVKSDAAKFLALGQDKGYTVDPAFPTFIGLSYHGLCLSDDDLWDFSKDWKQVAVVTLYGIWVSE